MNRYLAIHAAMLEEASAWLLIGGLAVAALLVLLAMDFLSARARKARNLAKEPHISKWTDRQGMLHTVTSPPEAGTVEQHFAVVRRLRRLQGLPSEE